MSIKTEMPTLVKDLGHRMTKKCTNPLKLTDGAEYTRHIKPLKTDQVDLSFKRTFLKWVLKEDLKEGDKLKWRSIILGFGLINSVFSDGSQAF